MWEGLREALLLVIVSSHHREHIMHFTSITCPKYCCLLSPKSALQPVCWRDKHSVNKKAVSKSTFMNTFKNIKHSGMTNHLKGHLRKQMYFAYCRFSLVLELVFSWKLCLNAVIQRKHSILCSYSSVKNINGKAFINWPIMKSNQ